MNLDRFKLDTPIITESVIETVAKYYEIDLTTLDQRDQELITNFLQAGASAAVMNRIVQLQEQEEL
jgi:hypothetical protein